jgi:hypothetical protein
MKYLKFLISPLFMGVLFVLFAAAMAVATFLENDFGSAAAYNMVYDAKWFELILLLLTVNLVGQVVALRLLKKEKLTIAIFHLSFIVMILGAGITRYFGWEGSIHIREGEEQNTCFSNEKYLGYSVKDNNGNLITSRTDKYSMTAVSADNYEKSFKINDREYDLILAKILPNATEVVTDSPAGEPIVTLLLTKDMMTQENITLRQGDTKISNGITIGFESQQPADLSIFLDSGKFFISSKLNLGEMNMMTQEVVTTEPGKSVELKKMQILTMGDIKIVPKEISVAGVIGAVAVKPQEQTTGMSAFIFHLVSGAVTEGRREDCFSLLRA